MDFWEGGEGFVCVWFIWEDCKGECYAFTRKASTIDTKKDKVPVLLSSLPNEPALVTDSEDDSDANQTFHDAETIPDEAHAPMPCLRARFLHIEPSLLILFRSYHASSLPFLCP